MVRSFFGSVVPTCVGWGVRAQQGKRGTGFCVSVSTSVVIRLGLLPRFSTSVVIRLGLLPRQYSLLFLSATSVLFVDVALKSE